MSIENKIEEYRKEGFPKVWVSDQGMELKILFFMQIIQTLILFV